VNVVTVKLQVEQLQDGVFQVKVSEGARESSHRVTLQTEYYQRIAGGKVEPAELVRRSFEFLLEHEPKESILSKFDLSDISRYFPNFEREIKGRLSGT
jgi:hypothetical protein